MPVTPRTEQRAGAGDLLACRQRFPSQCACAGTAPRGHRHLRELMHGFAFQYSRTTGRAALAQHELRVPAERARSGEEARMPGHATEPRRAGIVRSEERRVGKECGWGWSRYAA